MIVSMTQPLTRPILSSLSDAISAVFSGFNPRNLFAANEPGYLYDLDDQFAEKHAYRRNLLLWSEDFSKATWTTFNATKVGITTIDGVACMEVSLMADTAASLAQAVASIGITQTATFRVRAKGAATTLRIWFGNTDQSAALSVPEAWTTLTYTGNGSANTNTVSVRNGEAVAKSFYIALAQVNLGTVATEYQRVTDWSTELLAAFPNTTVFLDSAMTTPATVNGLVGAVMDKSPNAKHATQGTTGSKPILRGTPTGANLASGASWTAGTGWSIAGDTATATLSSGTLSAASIAAVVGKFYRVTYTITCTAGSIQPTLGGRTGTARSASGTYVQYFDNATSTAALVFTGTGFSGTVTLNSIEAVDVSAGSVTAPYALQFEVDDFMQTANVNFTATDKVTVCHGVRKLSDSAQGIVVEHTASLAANNGSFYLAAPNSAAANFAFASKGTVSATDVEVTFTAPISAVLTGVGNISGDSALLRVSGVAGTAVTTDQGTGNYANAALYFGRRGGASLPYNGLMYSSVCIGRLLTAAELANVERWVARKTGVTL